MGLRTVLPAGTLVTVVTAPTGEPVGPTNWQQASPSAFVAEPAQTTRKRLVRGSHATWGSLTSFACVTSVTGCAPEGLPEPSIRRICNLRSAPSLRAHKTA